MYSTRKILKLSLFILLVVIGLSGINPTNATVTSVTNCYLYASSTRVDGTCDGSGYVYVHYDYGGNEYYHTMTHPYIDGGADFSAYNPWTPPAGASDIHASNVYTSQHSGSWVYCY